MLTKKKTIYRIDFEGTLAKLNAAVDQIPPHMHNGRLRKPIKGNVTATAMHIYRIFMKQCKKSSRISTAFKTFNPSLAKVSKNCERTVQRHINKLMDLKILLGKVRLTRGIQLVLNRALLVFKTEEVAVQAPGGQTTAMNPSEIAQNPAAALEFLRRKFQAFPSLTVIGQKV